MQIFLFFALFISVLAVIFAVQNNTDATVTFAVWKFEESLALILLVAVAAGALISFLFSLPSNIKTRWTIRQQRKKMNEIETQLTSLRSQLEAIQLKESEKPAEILPVPVPIQGPAAPLANLPETTPSQAPLETDTSGEKDSL
jgi:uncharacterized integral membrane protein